MQNYSQNNEQDVILKYFSGKKGVFLDVGANDGVTLSNSRALALSGWYGVCVEPTIPAFAKLNALYEENKNVVTLKTAIGEKCGTVEIHTNGNHVSDNDTGLLSTVIESEKERWKEVQWETQIVNMVDYRGLLRWLKEMLIPFTTFDFITIDAEGLDVAILSQIDLSKTKMVCIEHNGSTEALNEIKRICTKYKLNKKLLHNAENVIYAR